MMYNRLKNPGTRVILGLLKDKKIVQRALNNMGRDLVVDGDIGNITIAAIKSVNNRVLHEKIEYLLYGEREKPSYTHLDWVKIAYRELGTKEIPGKKRSNHRVEQYHDATGYLSWALDDIPWCGSFVGFVMMKAGYEIPERAGTALEWLEFGKALHKPMMGAIAVKTRNGGGHVTFVVGVSEDDEYVYCLGGNQNDEVNIQRYRVTDFVDFRIPTNHIPSDDIPIMTGSNGSVRES